MTQTNLETRDEAHPSGTQSGASAQPKASTAVPHGGWVYGALVADHARLDALLEELCNAVPTGEVAVIDPIWTQLERVLLRHLETEEKYLMPLLAARDPAGAAALQSEHDAIRARLFRLGVDLELKHCPSQDILDMAQALREHARREERSLYDVAEAEVARPERHWLREILREIFAIGPREDVEEPS